MGVSVAVLTVKRKIPKTSSLRSPNLPHYLNIKGLSLSHTCLVDYIDTIYWHGWVEELVLVFVSMIIASHRSVSKKYDE